MKKSLIQQLAIFLLAFVCILLAFTRVNMQELIIRGNNEILQYCREHSLEPTFGIVEIRRNRKRTNLYYYIYTDSDKIFSIVLQANFYGEFTEFWTMVDTKESFLGNL